MKLTLAEALKPHPIETFLRTDAAIYLAATGAGAGAQHQLWKTPGASAYLMGASFPYATSELAHFVGYRPERCVQPEVVVDMAMAAYVRARLALLESGRPGRPVGVACTAAVATKRARRGADHAQIAVVCDTGVYGQEFVPKAASRGDQGKEIDDAILEMADVAVVDDPTGFVRECGLVECTPLAREQLLKRPFFSPVDRLSLADYASHRPDDVLFPGSFNPLHEGHLGLAGVASAAHSRNTTFCVNTNQPAKPPTLTLTDLLDRVAQVKHGAPGFGILLTQGAGLFVEKARQLPKRRFIIGVDTLDRMLDPIWGPVEPIMLELSELGATFLVFGRKVGDTFRRLSDVTLPTCPIPRFVELPGRWDVSSTALRAEAK